MRALQPKTLKEQYDTVLRPILQDVKADATILGASWEGDILVGGMPTNICNASVQKINGGYLILVSFGLIQLLHQLAKVFVSSAHLVMVAEGDEVPMAFADRLAFMPSDWTKGDALTAVTKAIARRAQDYQEVVRTDYQLSGRIYNMGVGRSAAGCW